MAIRRDTEKQPGPQSLAGDPRPASAHRPPRRGFTHATSSAKPQSSPGLSWPAARRSRPGRPPELPASPAASLLCRLGTQVAVEPDSRLRAQPAPRLPWTSLLILPRGEATLVSSKGVKKRGFRTRNTPGGRPRCLQGQLGPGACGLGQAGVRTARATRPPGSLRSACWFRNYTAVSLPCSPDGRQQRAW